MKEGWEYKKLGEVATFTRGLTYSKNDEAEISDNIVLRSNNVDLSTGKLNFDELKYLKPEFLIPEEKKVKKGSLLMCMSNGSKIHLGKVALINDDYPYAFGGFMALVTPNEELNPQFFNYSLSSPEYKDFIKKLSEGANINNIKVKELELFTIPIPPLSEQQSIVEYLDSAFAKIDAMKANAEKALNEAKALFQASLKEMLEPKEDWKYKKLGEVCEILDSRRKPITKNKREPGTIPYYGATGILDYVKDYIFDEKLVLLGEDGAKWGAGENSAYIIEGKTWVNNHAHALRPKRELLVDELLVYYLNFANLQPFITGVTVPKLNQEKMRSIEIPVPPISDQQSIVNTLDSLKSKVDRLQENYDKISQECDALKQAILRDIFE